MAPWEEVMIDLNGPWKVKVGSKVVEFSALTCIDTVSYLVELIRIDNKSSKNVRNKCVQSYYQDTHVQLDVSTTKVVSSLDKNSNGS